MSRHRTKDILLLCQATLALHLNATQDAQSHIAHRCSQSAASAMSAMSAADEPRDVECVSYDTQKSAVQQLKKATAEMLAQHRAIKEAESVALLEQRHAYEQRIQQLVDGILKLQQQLRQGTERSTKLRLQYEKEKKALQEQVDRLERSVRDAGASGNSRLKQLQKDHEDEVNQLQQQIAELERARVMAEQFAQIAGAQRVGLTGWVVPRAGGGQCQSQGGAAAAGERGGRGVAGGGGGCPAAGSPGRAEARAGRTGMVSALCAQL